MVVSCVNQQDIKWNMQKKERKNDICNIIPSVYLCSHLCVYIHMHTYTYIERILYIYGDFVTKSCPTLATPWAVARQAPLSMGFSRQEYWSGLPFPSPIYIYIGAQRGFYIYLSIYLSIYIYIFCIYMGTEGVLYPHRKQWDEYI